MIPVTYIPKQNLIFKTVANVIQCTIEQKKGIDLSASKTVVILQQNNGNAEQDLFNIDLALLYQTSLI